VSLKARSAPAVIVIGAGVDAIQRSLKSGKPVALSA